MGTLTVVPLKALIPSAIQKETHGLSSLQDIRDNLFSQRGAPPTGQRRFVYLEHSHLGFRVDLGLHRRLPSDLLLAPGQNLCLSVPR